MYLEFHYKLPDNEFWVKINTTIWKNKSSHANVIYLLLRQPTYQGTARLVFFNFNGFDN